MTPEWSAREHPLESSREAGVCSCANGLASVRVIDQPGWVFTVMQCLLCKDARVIRCRVPQ